MPGIRLRNIELFHQGTPRGVPYGPADFHSICRNFQAFSTGDRPFVRVPFVRGHEEADLKRTDIESDGWADQVRHDGKTLYGGLEDVSPDIAGKIEEKRFRTVSPEIYDSPPEGIPREAILAELRRRGFDTAQVEAKAKELAPRLLEADEKAGKPVKPLEWYFDQCLRMPLGKMLRRISALGGEIPQQKGKAELPMPERYAEAVDTRPVTLRYTHRVEMNGAWAVFSEVQKMGALEDYVHKKMPIIAKDHPEKTQEQRLGMAYGMGREKGLKAAEKTMPEMTPPAVPQAAAPPPQAPDRQAMIQSLGEKGMDTSVIDEKVPDACLAEMCRYTEGLASQQEPPGEEAYAEFDKGPEEDHADPEKAKEKMEFAEKMHGRFKSYLEKRGHRFGEATNVSALTAKPIAAPIGEPASNKFSEKQQQIIGSMIEQAVAKAMTRAESAAENAIAKLKAQTIADKRAGLEKFCEDLFKAGDLRPVDFDITKRTGPYLDYLMALPDEEKVHKYSENGKLVPCTPLGYEMLKAKGRLGLFGSKLKAGGAPSPESSLDADKMKVKELAVQKFSEVWQEQRKDVAAEAESLAKGFEAARKSEKTLTPEEFVGA